MGWRLGLIGLVLLIGGCGGSGDSTREAIVRMCPHDSLHPMKQFDTSELVGMTVRSAWAPALRHDCSVRVVKRNGRGVGATLDLRLDRIDVSVRDGRIVRVLDIG